MIFKISLLLPFLLFPLTLHIFGHRRLRHSLSVSFRNLRLFQMQAIQDRNTFANLPRLGWHIVVSSTKEKLDALKQAQVQAKEQLENGTLGQDKYDALQREIIETEQELRRLQQEAAQTMNYMAMAGWKTGDMLSGIDGIMNLAAASREDLATTSVIAACPLWGIPSVGSGRR